MKAPRYDVPKAAPEPLGLVQRFVNSRDREHGREWLGTRGELQAWLEAEGLPAGTVPTSADLRRARELRESLRALLIANNHEQVPPGADAAIANSGRRARLTVTVDAGVLALMPLAGGVDGSLGRIVSLAYEAELAGTWRRLKACRNCHWAFYDYSRNRSASWCSMSLCGNRVKKRAYRSRQAAR